jgi:hypothetical protein
VGVLLVFVLALRALVLVLVLALRALVLVLALRALVPVLVLPIVVLMLAGAPVLFDRPVVEQQFVFEQFGLVPQIDVFQSLNHVVLTLAGPLVTPAFLLSFAREP